MFDIPVGNYRGNEAIEFGPTPQGRSISAGRSGNEAGDEKRNRPPPSPGLYRVNWTSKDDKRPCNDL